mmetsp:Transcript_36947/g.90641  ORF Transcript_36947/g.90641 Transcript_36947/m.90641 type:complete len:1097 (-) Transcript_36947:151-3441(-)
MQAAPPGKGQRKVGKRELLGWAGGIAGRVVSRFEDLRDGVVLLRIFESVWPKQQRSIRGRATWAPQTEVEVGGNWDAIEAVLSEVGVPLEFVERQGIVSGKFRSSYTALVILFFLGNLCKQHDFTADFSQPVDPKVAAFLQSGASVQCLLRGGGLTLGNDSRPDRVAASEIRRVSRPTSPRDRSPPRSASPSVWAAAPLEASPRAEVRSGLAIGDLWGAAHTMPAPVASPPTHDASTSPTPARAGDEWRHDVGARQQESPPQAVTPTRNTEMLAEGPMQWRSAEARRKGEWVVTALRYEIDSLNRQLKHAADEAASRERGLRQRIGSLEEGYASQRERVQQECHAAYSQQLDQRDEELRALRRDMDLQLRRMEDDVTLQIEVSGSEQMSSEVRQLRAVLDARLATNERMMGELEKQNQRLRQELADSERRSGITMDTQKRVESSVEALLKDVSLENDGQIVKMLHGYDFHVESMTALERALVSAVAELRNIGNCERFRHMREEEALRQELQGKTSSGEVVSVAREMELEQDLERANTQKERLARSNDYLKERIKVLEKQFQGAVDDNVAGATNRWLPSVDVGDHQEALERDADLMRVLTLIRDGSSCLAAQNASAQPDYSHPALAALMQSGRTDRRNAQLPPPQAVMEGLRVCADGLLTSFWSVLAECLKYRTRVSRCRHVLAAAYEEADTANKRHLDLQGVFRDKLRGMVGTAKAHMADERWRWRQLVGKAQVELQVLRDRCADYEKETARAAEEASRAWGVCHDADFKKCRHLLGELQRTDMERRSLLAREAVWKDLTRCLTEMIKSPSRGLSEQIKTLWAKLVASKPADGEDPGVEGREILQRRLVEECTASLRAQIEERLREVTEAREAVREANSKREAAEARLVDLEGQKQSLMERQQDLQGTVDSTVAELDNLQAERKELLIQKSDDYARAEAEVQALRAELMELRVLVQQEASNVRQSSLRTLVSARSKGTDPEDSRTPATPGFGGQRVAPVVSTASPGGEDKPERTGHAEVTEPRRSEGSQASPGSDAEQVGGARRKEQDLDPFIRGDIARLQAQLTDFGSDPTDLLGEPWDHQQRPGDGSLGSMFPP